MLFSRELSVGNRIIDSEHKSLLIMITGLSEIIAAAEVRALSPAFSLLDMRLFNYFQVEGNIALAIGFDFTQHRLAHQNLLIEIHSIKDELMVKNGIWSKSKKERCVDSLMACLPRHIKEDSEPLKMALNNHSYDFKPD